MAGYDQADLDVERSGRGAADQILERSPHTGDEHSDGERGRGHLGVFML
jgi:hypothetical protein